MFRFGLIGFGKMGQIRRQTIDARKDCHVIAVCDPYIETTELKDIRVYKEWSQLLDNDDVDAVVVCCTNDLIPEVACAALQKGLHVFCEKPPGRTVADVERIRRAAAENPDRQLKFGFNHRYHEAVEDAHRLVASGRFGQLLWMRGVYGKAGGPGFAENWRNDPAKSGGGILLDQGIHMIDLFHNFAGEFDEYQSFVGRQYWDIPVEDNAFALLRNAAGQVAMLHSSATQWRHTFRLEIVMEHGLLSLNGILSSTMTYGKESLTVARNDVDRNGDPLPNPSETINYYDNDQSWSREIDEFVGAMRGEGAITIGTVDDALAAMRAVHAIYQASPVPGAKDKSAVSV